MSFLSGYARTQRRRQAGSILVNAAIAMSVMVIALIGTDLGYRFYVKRDMQKTADLAALAGAQALEPDNCNGATTAAIVNAGQNLTAGLAPLVATDVQCGHWDPVKRAVAPHFGAPTGAEKFNAVQVTIERAPSLFLSGTLFSVQALAATRQPRAALSIRNTLVTVDDTRSPLLNAVVGGMLGGSLTLDAVGWNGLVNTDIKLLSYLDQLGIDLGIGVGKYDEVLQTDFSVGALVEAMIHALEREGGTAHVAITALNALLVTANAAEAKPLLKLGDLLGVQSGTEAAGLGVDFQLFQLVQGMVQAANGKNGLVAEVPLLSIPGLVDGKLSLKVIEPPQFSAIGNPILAKAAPLGPDAIKVRTAQIRTMASLDLSGVAGKVTDVGNAALSALSPLTSVVDSVLRLNLVTAVNQLLGSVICPVPLLGISCPEYKEIYTKALSARLDIGLEVGNAQAHMTDFDCGAGGSKSLTASARGSIAEVRVGSIASAFASNARPSVEPVALVEVGYTTARPGACLLGVLCTGWQWKQASGPGWGAKATAAKTVVAGLGAQVGSSDETVGSPRTLRFQAPAEEALPEVTVPFSNDDTSHQSLESTDLVAQVGNLVGGVSLNIYHSDSPGILGALLSLATNALNGLVSTLQGVVKSVLAPLVDPLLAKVLQTLGIALNDTAVGARLSCSAGAELVY